MYGDASVMMDVAAAITTIGVGMTDRVLVIVLLPKFQQDVHSSLLALIVLFHILWINGAHSRNAAREVAVHAEPKPPSPRAPDHD